MNEVTSSVTIRLCLAITELLQKSCSAPKYKVAYIPCTKRKFKVPSQSESTAPLAPIKFSCSTYFLVSTKTPFASCSKLSPCLPLSSCFVSVYFLLRLSVCMRCIPVYHTVCCFHYSSELMQSYRLSLPQLLVFLSIRLSIHSSISRLHSSCSQPSSHSIHLSMYPFHFDIPSIFLNQRLPKRTTYHKPTTVDA